MAVSPPAVPTASDSLSMAMVTFSEVPLLLLDAQLHVIAASKTFCSSFNIHPDRIIGLSIFSLGSGEWDLPKLRSLLSATGSGLAEIDVHEMDLDVHGQSPRRLVIHARKLDYGDAQVTRILVTISDITDARLAEKIKLDLLQDKAMLLQEIQHRVANSLQIIASVLMQSARNVQSEETRRHLSDAHNRVMSIASVQRQLASSNRRDVELRPYLVQLCKSLSASMIRDHGKQVIEVNSDRSVVDADVSISIGLIVTELVINALKHAFPNGESGKIVVRYQSKGPNWTLSVGDNGVGMPGDPVSAKPGLGTSIVEALAKQLRAHVKIGDLKPGIKISIIHNSIAAVDLVGRAI